MDELGEIRRMSHYFKIDQLLFYGTQHLATIFYCVEEKVITAMSEF
jgi:hypothetical protein